MKFTQGNFDYSGDGKVTILDFNLLAANFGKQVAAPSSPATMAVSARVIQPVPVKRASAWRSDLLEDAQLV
jgi:hypothetical protein